MMHKLPKTAKQYPQNTQKADHHSVIFVLPLGQKGFILVYKWWSARM